MIRRRHADAPKGASRLVRRRVVASNVSRRRRGSVKTRSAALPLAIASRSLRRLRGDIDVLVVAVGRESTASGRAALVEVHHQLRLLGQRVNAALGAPSAKGDGPPQR